MATNLGKVGIVAKGTWSNSASYEMLDAVSYGGNLYIAKQDVPVGTAPSYTQYWMLAVDNSLKADKVTGATASDFVSLDSNGNILDSGARVESIKRVSVDLSIDSTDKVKISTSSGTNAYMVILKGNRQELYCAFLVIGFSGGSTRNNIIVIEKGDDIDTISIDSTDSTDYDVHITFTGSYTGRATTVTAIPFVLKTFTITKE